MQTIRIALVLMFLFVPSFALAQEQQQVLLATVNISKADIVSQAGNTFTIAFTITNREIAQSGVKYGVQLVRETDQGGQIIVDEKVYDEKLALAENSSVQREVDYTAPIQFAGQYSLYLTSSNEGGFPFAVAFVDTVTLASSAGIVVHPESCTTQVNSAGTSYSLAEVPMMEEGQTLALTCSVTNTTDAAVAGTPQFETRYEDAYGQVVPGTANSAPAVMLAPGAQERVSFMLPLVQKPGIYSVSTQVVAPGAQSNAVSVRYVISGIAASIMNVSLDKGSYDKGDIATISLVWKSTVGTDITLTGTVTNGAGLRCASPISQTISRRDIKPVTSIVAAITRQCRNPQVNITLTDLNGTVLDEKEFSFQGQTTPTDNKDVWWILGILVALTALGLYAMKKHDAPADNMPPTTMVLALFLAAGLILFPAQASADTYGAGPGGYIQTTVNLENYVSVNSNGVAEYALGQSDNLRVTAQLHNIFTYTYPVRATVRTNGSVNSTLYNGNIGPNAYTQIFQREYPVPGSIGAYTVDLSTLVYTNTILGPAVGSGQTIEQGSYPSAIAACGAATVRAFYQIPTAPANPSPGLPIYDDSTLTVPVNTGGRWARFLFNVGSPSSTAWAIQTHPNGSISSAVAC